MTNKEKVNARLQPPSEEPKRQIMIKLKHEQIETLRDIAKAMSEISGSHVSRNMLIQDAIEAYVLDFEHPDILPKHIKQMEMVSENKAYVEQNRLAFDDTKFYFDNKNEKITMVYYNPDSNAGGQFVYNDMYLSNFTDSFAGCETPEEFWELFHSNSHQWQTDIDSLEFADEARRFVEEPCDCSGESQETLDAIREWTIEQCPEMEQSQGMNM